MAQRDRPYNQFNFLVDLGNGVAAGFSEVSGLSNETSTGEYRQGNELESRVPKISGMHKFDNVTLKRGIVGATDLFNWINAARNTSLQAKRSVQITLVDNSRSRVTTRRLSGAMPLKWTGPDLAAKGDSEVAIEELVLSYDGLTVE